MNVFYWNKKLAYLLYILTNSDSFSFGKRIDFEIEREGEFEYNNSFFGE